VKHPSSMKRARDIRTLAPVGVLLCSVDAVVGTFVKHARSIKPARGVRTVAIVGVLFGCAGVVASSGFGSSGGAAVADKAVPSKSSAPVFTHTLRRGQSGSDIVTLQTWLSDVGYQVPATGYFGTMTKSAVRSFQVANRLFPASGSVGDRTSAALLAAVSKTAPKQTAPKPKPIRPASNNSAGMDPIPGFSIERDDMGVDASAAPGAGIYAPLASVLVQVLPDWYAGQPLLLFRFDNTPAHALSGYWYVAEQIVPVTTATGTSFKAGQRVASFADSGTGIEIGWGSPTSNARTLADVTDPGAANPLPGSTTVWGESFKQFFGIK